MVDCLVLNDICCGYQCHKWKIIPEIIWVDLKFSCFIIWCILLDRNINFTVAPCFWRIWSNFQMKTHNIHVNSVNHQIWSLIIYIINYIVSYALQSFKILRSIVNNILTVLALIFIKFKHIVENGFIIHFGSMGIQVWIGHSIFLACCTCTLGNWMGGMGLSFESDHKNRGFQPLSQAVA